jgi:LysR family transcriptional regulator, regulator for bpeEF and oprC
MRRIESLVRAAEAGSFAKAARSLDLTPSAVSHAIADLEKGLGVSLFHRTTRQLRLTEEGEGVYRRGCELLRQLAELESGTRKTERLTGTLRVGLAGPLSRNVIMPRLFNIPAAPLPVAVRVLYTVATQGDARGRRRRTTAYQRTACVGVDRA